MILNIGLTHEIDSRQDHRDQIQTGISWLTAMRSAARRINPAVFCLMFGGIVTTAQDFESVLIRRDIDGSRGGLGLRAAPVQPAVESTIRQFRYVTRLAAHSPSRPATGPLIGETPVTRSCGGGSPGSRRSTSTSASRGDGDLEGARRGGDPPPELPPRGPFITLNCGTMTDSLLRRASCSATRRSVHRGRPPPASASSSSRTAGTLFLDEVADLTRCGPRSPSCGRFSRGGPADRQQKPIHVDVRIVTATHHGLADVDEGLFRADLYFRLQLRCRSAFLASSSGSTTWTGW